MLMRYRGCDDKHLHSCDGLQKYRTMGVRVVVRIICDHFPLPLNSLFLLGLLRKRHRGKWRKLLGSRLLPRCEIWGQRRAREAAHCCSSRCIALALRAARPGEQTQGPQLLLRGTEHSCAPGVASGSPTCALKPRSH